MGVSENRYNDSRGSANSSVGPRSSSSPSAPSSSRDKPSYRKVGGNSLKKIKFHSNACEDASRQERVFLKLDPKNPTHAHKIQQRRKAIAKGKNTIGYDRYSRSVPKEKRQKRSMITPSTPDHTLDIPNKKWNGLVRSWRVALHRYDPVDLQQSFTAARETAQAEQRRITRPPGGTAVDDPAAALTVKEKELADSGLSNLVRVTTAECDDDDDNRATRSGSSSSSPTRRNLFSPTTPVAAGGETNSNPLVSPEDNHGSLGSGIVSEMNRWDEIRRDNDEESFFSMGNDSDSDDDLL
eukprot:CAMPEP_0197188980 /NCGR_PEP_ID=MMETSP1423-20130617/18909_1 /TAXON_ID=476441 /ORGANISM="Pseudo-nitzschia heimii, Strain UNC1101" /LENGTH=295 /DNA_ID=CAMNT_0042640983 /DNA_START=372 /DNA_END=1259 /DNA_ORIENTATION=+